MRILIVHNRYRSAEPGGEDRVVDQESEALVAAGHMLERFEVSNDAIDAMSVTRKAVVPAQVVWNERSRRALAKVLASRRPDVVHLHNTFPLLSPSVLYACHSAGVPVVMTLHNYRLACPNGTLYRDGAICHDCVGRLPLPGVRHGCYKQSRVATAPAAAELIVHRRAWRSKVSAFVCISDSQRQILATAGLPRDRLFVKHNFVPPLAVPPQECEHIVVYAGRLTESKGIPLLMRAWDQARAALPTSRLRLVVAGTGPLAADVGDWAAQRPSVDFVGLLDRDACARLVARARAAVVPSEWEEAFGLIAVEAMSVGVPPIAPERGSFPELITDGHDGVLFPPGDAGALAGVFADIEAQPQRYRDLGRTARSTYRQRFTPETSVAQLVQIYRFAMSKATP